MTEISAEQQAFSKWFTEGPFNFNKSLEISSKAEGGRGVVASNTIEDGELLFNIPAEYLLSSRTIKNAKLGEALETSDMPSFTCLVLAVMAEDCLPDSKWREYLNVLPKTLNTPLFWSDDEVALLDGTGLQYKIGKEIIESDYGSFVTEFMEEFPQDFPKSKCSLDQFVRIGSLVMAYSFTSEEGEMYMVPMADMLNHKTGVNNARCFEDEDSADGSLRMVAVEAIDKDCEVFNTYGTDLCNSDLLRKYGFIDVDNSFDIAEIMGEKVTDLIDSFGPQNLREAKKKAWIGGCCDTEIFVIAAEAEGEVEEDLRIAARFLLSDNTAIVKKLRKNGFEYLAKLDDEVDGEDVVVKAIIDAALAAYPERGLPATPTNTPPSDEKEWRKWAAAYLRASEVAILTRATAALETPREAKRMKTCHGNCDHHVDEKCDDGEGCEKECSDRCCH